VPLGSRIVIAGRARLARVLAGDDVLPITRRFYGGGPSSQRGFAQQHLSPFATGASGDTVPIAARRSSRPTSRPRVDLVRVWGDWLGMVVFLDGADVTLAPASSTPRPCTGRWAWGCVTTRSSGRSASISATG